MSVKRYKMPWHESPMDWPRELRPPGTEVVLASDYDALTARVAELEKDAARYRWIRDHAEVSFDRQVKWKPTNCPHPIFTRCGGKHELDLMTDADMVASDADSGCQSKEAT